MISKDIACFNMRPFKGRIKAKEREIFIKEFPQTITTSLDLQNQIVFEMSKFDFG